MDMELTLTLRTTSGSNNKRIMVLYHLKAVCSLSIVLFLFLLSQSSFEYAKFKTRNNNNDLSQWNLYVNKKITQTYEINKKINEIQGVLEYMVWPVQHQKARREYLSLLKKKIILNPNESRSWQLLLAELERQNVSSKEITWSLSNAIEFNKWNIKSRPWLAFYCIELNHQLDDYLQTKCINLIKKLPLSINRNRLANMIGINREKLDFTLQQLNIPNLVSD